MQALLLLLLLLTCSPDGLEVVVDGVVYVHYVIAPPLDEVHNNNRQPNSIVVELSSGSAAGYLCHIMLAGRTFVRSFVCDEPQCSLCFSIAGFRAVAWDCVVMKAVEAARLEVRTTSLNT